MDVTEFKTGEEYRAWLKRNGRRVKIVNVSRGADESYAVTYAIRISTGARAALILAMIAVILIIVGVIWANIIANQDQKRMSELNREAHRVDREARLSVPSP